MLSISCITYEFSFISNLLTDGIKFVNNKTELSMGVGNVDELGLNKYKVYSKTKPQKDDKVYKTTVRPVLSLDDGKYHLGMWVRDSSAGVGTLTFYNPETKIRQRHYKKRIISKYL